MRDGLGVLHGIRNGNFVMADAAVEIGEQGGNLVSDDSGFEVWACEIADGIERTPGGFHDNFDFAFEAT